MLTYEKLRPILYKIASKYARAYHFKYEIDELINEVWLAGRVQNLADIRFATRRISFDIIDYIRQQEGSRSKYRIYNRSLNAVFGTSI